MNKRLLAFLGIGISSVVVLLQTWVWGDDFQSPWFVWVLVLAVLAWSLWQLRDRSFGKGPVFDFNPRRGLMFFFIGFVAFPLMLGMNALFGDEFSLASAVLITVAGSVFAGIVGTFTENIGI